MCRSSFLNQGEICLCTSRVFVQRPVYDQFLARLVAAVAELRVGDPALAFREDPESRVTASSCSANIFMNESSSACVGFRREARSRTVF